MMIDLEDFKEEKECVYKEERYSVRDNGAVFRHARENKRLRENDNQWIFGKPNKKTGYKEIASIPIHGIIATAFHGERPTPQHIVDHIDTNRQNNRPENLRWVTRLENVLLNPITLKRIELACGCSIDEFLTDPSRFRDKFQEPKYEWMSTVSVQEAQASKERLSAWAKSDKNPSGGSLGEWIYNRSIQNQDVEEVQDYINSLTQNAVQKNWKTPSEFPCCPQVSANSSIATYFDNLEVEKVFSRNDYSDSIITDFAKSKDGNTIWVLCKNSDNNAIKPWSLAEVTYEKDLFVHASIRSFFEKAGAEKCFTLAQGLEWTGEETNDDLI